MNQKIENLINVINELLQEEEFELIYSEKFANKCIILSSPKYNCSPIIYLDHKIWSESNENIASFLKDIYKQHSRNINVSSFMNKDFVLSHVLPRVYSIKNLKNMEKNNYLCKKMFDLVINYYIPLEDSNINISDAFVSISNDILSHLNISEEELILAADKNIADKTTIKPLSDVLKNIQGMEYDNYFPDDSLEPKMLLVTNSIMCFGAGAITSEIILNKISETLGTQFMILPSSIHELICVPYKSEEECFNALEMVTSINNECVFNQKIPFLKEEDSFLWKHDTVNNPSLAASLFRDCFQAHLKAEEYLYMLALSPGLLPLGVFEVAHGIINSCLASPREIFIRALLCGASSIILAHNHTDDIINPSKDDLLVSKRICEVGNYINIKLSDFLIIGTNYFSFQKNDLLEKR